ncbi:DUF305 domain-containing protein [Actinokineospora sp.]|uniref:DUF305 domain-containing protein n=1 Tax=Actinokineospora sp. TaxID=1872133 RepID=UPI003D6BA5DB
MKATGHHGDGGDGGVKAMPGMATRDEIARLRTLTGTELDVYFPQLMLRHQRGGLPMATNPAEHRPQPRRQDRQSPNPRKRGHDRHAHRTRRDTTTRLRA